MKNSLDDLRNHLFETLEALKDEEKPMDIDRAKAISGVASTIIESAKVEVQYLELTGQEPSPEGFFKRTKRLPATEQQGRLGGGK